MVQKLLNKTDIWILKVCSDRASASAAAASLASSLVVDYIDLYLCHSDQVAAAVLAMTLGVTLGPIWIFDSSNAADARSERALSRRVEEE